jgi:hypothetical protein
MRIPQPGTSSRRIGIHDPDPEEALRLYTLFYRVVMWCYPTRCGGCSDGFAGLMRALGEMRRRTKHRSDGGGHGIIGAAADFL